MKTMSLKNAAEFLNMNFETLREKAKAGIVPGAKVGKSWVFIEEDLAYYIRSQYAASRQAVRVTNRIKEANLCHSTAEVASGGCVSQHQTDAEYTDLLGL